MPRKRLGYTALPDYQYHHEWGSAGFNSLGIGESSTETIFSSPKALEFDPYVKDGLAENCTYNIVLPYIHSAREGVERLGALIEKYGSAEGFGIGFRRPGISRTAAGTDSWPAACLTTSTS